MRSGEEGLSSGLTILFYVVFIVSLFFIQNVYLHIFTAAATLCIALIALPLKKMKSGPFPITLFLVFTFGGNLFFHSGRILYSSGILSITSEGLHLAGIRTLRVFSMIFAAKILTGVLSMDELIQSVESMLRPLERTGIPVRDFFSVMGLTLKVFPVLMTFLLKEYREDTKISDIRGVRQRMRHMVSFLMPVFVKSIQSPESFFETENITVERKL